jgi:branched-chain amino acid transport system permease protein
MFTSAAPTIFRLNGWIVPGWAFFLFIFVGVTLAAVVGILLGLPVLRLRGDYLAIVTLGFGEMIRVLANNADQPINLTNGSQGLQGVGRPPLPPGMIDTVSNIGATLNIHIANIEPVTRQLFFYFIAIIILAIVIVIARRLDDSVIGRAWTAIREDEIAAIAMGVPLVRMKLMAFASGAAFAGAIGVLYAAKQTFVSPESFSLTQSISVLAMVIVGGLGGIRGVILGGCVVTLLNLQVLKNLSLQINNWKNTDAVLPGWVIALVIVALVVLIAWIIWRIRSRQDWSWSTRITAIVPLGVIAIALMAALTQVSDFRMKTWPAQLEPAKYEQLVFGILLILMMLFRPAGILPEPRRQMEMQKRDQTEGDIKLKSTPAGQSG